MGLYPKNLEIYCQVFNAFKISFYLVFVLSNRYNQYFSASTDMFLFYEVEQMMKVWNPEQKPYQ
jgi:hypothetical protein